MISNGVGSVGLRSVQRNFGRYVLTLVGATLGVAVLFGVMATNASLNTTLERALGPQQVPRANVVPIGSYGNTLPVSMVDQVAALPEVGRAAAVVFVAGKIAGTSNEIDIVGVRERDGSARQAISELPTEKFEFEGREPAPGADEVSLTRGQADWLKLEIGSPLEVVTRTGPVRFTVVRISDVAEGAALTSFETAARIQGQGDVVQNIQVRLADNASVEAWSAQHAGAFPNARIESGGGDNLRAGVQVLQNAFSALGLMSAFVGGFLIYITLSTSVTERARTWGVLRAVGGRRRDVVRAVVFEALVIGAIATVLGVIVGAMLGWLLLGFTQTMYNLPRGGFTISTGTLVAGALLGLVIPPVASVAPAWRAAKAEPVDSMRERHVDTAKLGRAWIVGVVLLVFASLAARANTTNAGMRLAPLMFLFGSVLIVPVALGPIARLVGKASARLAPGLGDAAVNHLVRERTRSAYTLGLIMIVLAMILAIGAIQTSIVSAVHDAWKLRYSSDVMVGAWNGMTDDVANAIRSAEGVAQSTPFRSGRVGVGPQNQPVELTVIEPDSFFTMQGLPWKEGSDEAAHAALKAGGAVLIPEVYAAASGLGAGDRLLMQTTQGPQELAIAGVYSTPQRGVRVFVGEADGNRLFGAGPITGFELKAAEGVTPDALRERLTAIVGDRPGFWVNTMANEEVLAARGVEGNLRPFFAVTLLAGVVGILGLANTLAMAIVRRTREIGVLRAIGIGQGALGRMVLVESLTMTAVAFVLALPLGWLLSRSLLRASSSALGFLVDLRLPVGMLPTLLITVVVIAGIASFGPARRIARLDPVAALRFE